MTKRLKCVIAALYRRPDDGIRQMFALSRDEAERLPRPLGCGHLHNRTWPPPCKYRRLRAFATTELRRRRFSQPDALSQGARNPRRRLHRRASPGHSAIRRVPAETRNLGCRSLRGGYSRSCAVALALHRLYGYQVALGRLTQANPSVVSVMMAEVRPQRKARCGQV